MFTNTLSPEEYRIKKYKDGLRYCNGYCQRYLYEEEFNIVCDDHLYTICGACQEKCVAAAAQPQVEDEEPQVEDKQSKLIDDTIRKLYKTDNRQQTMENMTGISAMFTVI